MSIAVLQSLLVKGTDNALLRFGLGKSYLDAGDAQAAVEHLQRCVSFDEGYSAAWKLLGKALNACADSEGARKAWLRGIEVAQAKGDKQAEKEMSVFLRKLDKAS